jgi:hypothetical protein
MPSKIDFNKIDPRFIDCEFPADPNYKFGALAPDALKGFCAGFGAYEDRYGVIPTNEWVEMAAAIEEADEGAEWLVTRIYDQGQEGSCVGNAKAQQCEILQAKQYGRDRVVPMSAISIYDWIGRSAQSGAYVPDASEQAKDVGVLPLDTTQNRAIFGAHVKPATGFGRAYADGWKETAKLFKDDEQLVIRTYEGLVSAMLRGDVGPVGRDGHCICYAGVPRFTTNSVNSIRQPYPNSWKYTWGVPLGHMRGGFGFDTYNTIRRAAGYLIVARSIVDRRAMRPDTIFATAV